MAAASEPTKTAADHGVEPIIVDLGKKRRKQVKQLREGRGKLLTEVSGLLAEMRTAGSLGANVQPVVVVVRQRRRSRSLLWPLD
jgi:hypothetical protein